MRKQISTLLAVSALAFSTASMAANPTTKTTATKTTTTANTTLLKNDLTSLIQAGKVMEVDTRNKQVEMSKRYEPKVEKATTQAQKQALQSQFLTEVISFKNLQKQKLQAVPLTEPRVAQLRNEIIETFNSDNAAAQILIDNPTPTPESQKKFVEAITKSENLTQDVHNKFEALMKEAGISKDSLKINK